MRALGLLVLAVLLLPAAAAHAELDKERSLPPAKGNVAAGATEITLVFTENVNPDATHVAVTAPDGTDFREGPLRVQGNVVVAPVRPLTDGLYGVAWRTVSVDTHPTRGTYFIAAGTARVPDSLSGTDSDDSLYDAQSVLRDGVARAAFYGGVLLVVGVPVFLLVVDRGASPDRRAMLTAGTFALLGAMGGLLSVIQYAERALLTLADAAATDGGGTILRRTAFLGLAGAACGAAALGPVAWRRRMALLAVGFGLAALFSTAFSSHAAAVRESTNVAILADVVHLTMGALWVGGVVAFAHVAVSHPAADLARMVARFTPIAIASVAALLLTGLYAMWRHIPSLEDVWSTPYGQLAAAKALLLLPLIGIGAYHRQKMGPGLRGKTVPPARFRKVLALEVGVMVIVLAVAGTLAASPPPVKTTSQQLIVPEDPCELPSPFFEEDKPITSAHLIARLSKPNGDGTAALRGIQDVLIIVHTAENFTRLDVGRQAPGQPIDEVQLEEPEKVAENCWLLDDVFLDVEGTWTFTIHFTPSIRGSPADIKIPVKAT